MPTNQNVYNSRVTSEALEKRFRDTFRAQGGAELVDDLYAQGVIVPVVDFTAAATQQTLAQNLQTAWDFSTGFMTTENTTNTIISNAGFWQVDLSVLGNGASGTVRLQIDSGITLKTIWNAETSAPDDHIVVDNPIIVFLRAGDSLQARSFASNVIIHTWYRQIATVNGDPVNPFGFESS